MSLTFRNGGFRVVRPVPQPQVIEMHVLPRPPTPMPAEPVFQPIEVVPEPVPEPAAAEPTPEPVPEPAPEPEVTVPTTENDA